LICNDIFLQNVRKMLIKKETKYTTNITIKKKKS